MVDYSQQEASNSGILLWGDDSISQPRDCEDIYEILLCRILYFMRGMDC
jgi:hypothetical protein